MPTRTFLFSDIEGSTQRWREQPDQMRETLAAHDRLVERVIAEAGGRIFKHTGDGVAAVFESAEQALVAAIEYQRALGDPDEAALETLRVRIGVHTGDAEERDGDWFGFTVSRTARLMDAGHGGQVLVSSITEQLVPDGRFELRSLGEHRLPDLSRPERIFQVVEDGMEHDFPPLRTIDDSPNNLPVMTTSFVGRDQELAEVAKLVAGARLVTITGVGGSGKTRVALHTAADLATEHPDGVWLIELAPVTDPDLVDGAMVTSIGAAQPSGVTPREALLDHLSRRNALLVVDNCEHVIASAAETIEAILTHAADVTVLATSRELLGVPGEISYGLRSMQISKGADLEELRRSDAVRLFEERAIASKPDFRVAEDNVDAVVEICRRLDGMPLAIELAASRLRSFGPTQIAEHLDQRFRLLTGGSRTALPRQQTLTAAIDWSYRLLADEEAALFRRLSVFQGGFTFEAVREVCSGEPVDELDLFELLPALVDKSLLVADHDDEHGSRYRLLETLRQFARDHLDETGEADAWRERHAEFFAELSRRGTIENLNGPKAEHWTGRILSEADNIRQAITWSLDAHRPDTAMRAAYGLFRLLLGRGQWSETLAVYRRIAEQESFLPPHLRAQLSYKLGITLVHSPEPELGIQRLEEAIRRYEELAEAGTDPELIEHHPLAILNLAVALFYQDRVGENNEVFVELVNGMLDIVRERGDKVLESVALANLAHHGDPRRDPDETRALFDQAEAASSESGIMDPDAIASQRGYFEFEQGELRAARREWERSLEYIARSAVTEQGESACLAAVEILLGVHDGREPFDERVRALFSDEDTRTGLRFHQTLLALRAGIDAHAGRHEDTATAAGAIDSINTATGNALRWDLQGFLADAEGTARDALGAEEYESIRSRAAELSPEQVTAFLMNAT